MSKPAPDIPVYRAYAFGDQGHIRRAELIEAANDVEAEMHTRNLFLNEAAELWDRARLVARLAPRDSFQPLRPAHHGFGRLARAMGVR